MVKCILQFELAEGGDAGAIAADIEARLRATAAVERAEVVPRRGTRMGVAEAATLLAAAVLLVRQGKELTQELRDLLRAMREVLAEVGGVKAAYLELRGRRIAIDEVSEADLAEIARPR